jgi:DNA-binding NarL/FixJ family response regulator
MNKINVAILDEHQIVVEGISELLRNVEDIKVILRISDKKVLFENIRSADIHILIINSHNVDSDELSLIQTISSGFPRVKILVLSIVSDESLIFKAIKAGAKGFLAKDTSKNELIEAIYSLRNGYDFFSSSITSILLNQYINSIKSDKQQEKRNKYNLSARELEIIKLWGSSYTNKEIADKLFISVRTVESHKNHVMQKLNMKTIVDLVKFALKNNIIEI